MKHSPCERVGAFELVELVVDALAQVLVVYVSQQEFGTYRPTQLAQGQVHGVILGVRTEAPQHGGGS